MNPSQFRRGVKALFFKFTIRPGRWQMMSRVFTLLKSGLYPIAHAENGSWSILAKGKSVDGQYE